MDVEYIVYPPQAKNMMLLDASHTLTTYINLSTTLINQPHPQPPRMPLSRIINLPIEKGDAVSPTQRRTRAKRTASVTEADAGSKKSTTGASRRKKSNTAVISTAALALQKNTFPAAAKAGTSSVTEDDAGIKKPSTSHSKKSSSTATAISTAALAQKKKTFSAAAGRYFECGNTM
jgi:hypothetical protein